MRDFIFATAFACLLTAVAAAAACAGADTPSEGVSSSPTLSETTNAQALCVQSFERQRECTATFIPALVAARVRVDKPAGIAQEDQTAGRAALVAQAQQEWTNDSTDPAINQTCAGMVQHGMVNAEMIAAVNNCLAASDCDNFVPCQIQIIEGHLAQQ